MTTYYRLGDTISEARYIKDEYLDRWTPVVVIDPEDREEVERLAGMLHDYDAHLADDPHRESAWVSLARDALREFANPTPPKPEEPTGIGALVRDDEGDLWQRDARAREGYPWTRISDTSGAGASKSTHDAYKHIAAIEVLFEGVTA